MTRYLNGVPRAAPEGRIAHPEGEIVLRRLGVESAHHGKYDWNKQGGGQPLEHSAEDQNGF